MVAYNFKKRFIEPIQAGTKRQTIRAPRDGRSRHARPGEEVQLYFGLRSRQTQMILHGAVCTAVETVSLNFVRDSVLLSSGIAYDLGALDLFAVDDGFADWADLKRFWAEEHSAISVFGGILIRWEGGSLPVPLKRRQP